MMGAKNHHLRGILDALATAPLGKSLAELMQITGWSRSTINLALREMHAEGKVEKSSTRRRGVGSIWSLPSDADVGDERNDIPVRQVLTPAHQVPRIEKPGPSSVWELGS